MSTAKAMAYALDVPLHPISTLAALAAAAVPQALRGDDCAVVLPLLYARRGRAFGGIYQKMGAGWRCVVDPAVLPVSVWRERLSEVAGDVIGDAAGSAEPATRAATACAIVHDFVPRYGLEDELEQMPTRVQIRLADMAGSFGRGLLTAFVGTQGITGTAIHGVEPVYLLQTEAEVKLAGGTGA